MEGTVTPNTISQGNMFYKFHHHISTHKHSKVAIRKSLAFEAPVDLGTVQHVGDMLIL